MKLDWHAATVSRRGDKYYIVMTVPKSMRAELGGATQRRLSAGTTDFETAKRKRHDLEAELRHTILADLEKARLVDPQGDYQRAVASLGLADTVYSIEYDATRDDILETTMVEPPTNEKLLADAEKTLKRQLARIQSYHSGDLERTAGGTAEMLKTLKDFQLNVPAPDVVEAAVISAVAAARRANGVAPARHTLSSIVPLVEEDGRQLVQKGSLKRKTAKQRIRHLKQFVEMIGDHALEDLEPIHAYAYAEALAEELANKTINARISDVRVALHLAVKKGLLKVNPFLNLSLKHYGTGTKNYDPLSDEQIKALVGQPKLPDRIRTIWLILACTGMRVDEVATLRCDQVKHLDGIWYFDLRHAQVKNKSSMRRVPICDALFPLVHQLLKDRKGQERLFDYELNADGKTRASTQMNYWFKKAGVENLSEISNGHFVTHSLRGTFKDKLRDADVLTEINKSIHGHGLGGMEDIYGHGFSLRKLKDAVDKVPHPYLNHKSKS